jgi:hypothetical protein
MMMLHNKDNTMNLYEISCRYQQLLDQDEYTNEEMAELELLHGNVEDGVISHAKYIQNLVAEQKAIFDAMESMEARHHELTLKIEKQKQKLESFMVKNKITAVKSPLFDVKYSVNRPSVDVFDENLLPESCWRVQEKVVKSVDKMHIKELIDSGVTIAGARLVSKTKVDIK